MEKKDNKKVEKIEKTKQSKINIKKYVKYGIILGLILTFIIGILWPTKRNIYNVEISIKDYGIIKLELDGDEAPITVANFIKLVNEKFYDGLTFHRIYDGFMIQGGDPNGDGTGGSEETIKGEFSSNGIENNISHERGVISMARNSYSNDSASSQFFIMQETNTGLDGYYAAFGKVTSGIEIVDKIVETVASLGDENGLIPSENQPTIEYIKVIENEE